MFDPLEFFYLARKLFTESDPLDSSAARTCINRAYYAAFLVVREKYKIKDEGLGTHIKVITSYKNKDLKLGNKLADLFIKRKEADYSLNANITNLNSGKALKQAEEILEKNLGKKLATASSSQTPSPQPQRLAGGSTPP